MTSRTRHECWEATYVHVRRRYSLDVFLKKFVGAVGDFTTTAAVILVCVDEKKVARDEMNSATSKT